MNRRSDILKLIKRIRESFDGSIKIYTEGSCIQFSMILLEVFKDGEIYFNEDHSIFKLDDHFYDITGEVELTNHIPLLGNYHLLSIYDLMSKNYYE